MVEIKIWACCKDTGGTKGVVQVLRKLEQAGRFKIRIFANGVAPRFLEEAGVTEYEVCDDPTSVLASTSERPSFLLTSLDSPGSIGAKMVRALRAEDYKGTIIALSDYPVSSALTNDWTDIRPNYITSGGLANTAVIKKLWPEFEHGQRIVETGYPAFDRLTHLNVPEIRARIRKELGIAEDRFLITLLTEKFGAAEVLEQFTKVFKELGSKALVAIRPHPGIKADPEENERFLKEKKLLSGQTVETVDKFTTEEVMAASDAVVATYSTALGEASAMGIPSVNFVIPMIEKIYMERTSGVAPVFPWVSEGVCSEARTTEELKDLLKSIITGETRSRSVEAQRHLLLDGSSATRVSKFIDHIAACRVGVIDDNYVHEKGLVKVGEAKAEWDGHPHCWTGESPLAVERQSKDYTQLYLQGKAADAGAQYIVIKEDTVRCEMTATFYRKP
ncbi:MAG: CDP-glycerol glycerophosphotransferase family protein [Patescibacteria group bacterium]|nr:CDP-glycerol glycerophosphotransferase family protein [Patescibacteria group bacterium]